jgi:hypothetical protein
MVHFPSHDRCQVSKPRLRRPLTTVAGGPCGWGVAAPWEAPSPNGVGPGRVNARCGFIRILRWIPRLQAGKECATDAAIEQAIAAVPLWKTVRMSWVRLSFCSDLEDTAHSVD